MPLSLDTLLAQPASLGSFVGTSGPASLGSGTTAGNTVLLICTTRGLSVSTPSGFVATDTPATQNSNTKTYVFRRSNVPASETSWTVTQSGAVLLEWAALELVGLDPDAPLDVGLSVTVNTTSGTTAPSGTTPRSTTFDGVALAVHAAWNAASTTAPVWSGHTNGFAELVAGGGNDGTGSLGLSVSALPVSQLGTWTTTATSSITLTATNSAGSMILVFSAAGAKREANVQFFWGFFPGVASTPAGLGTGNAGSRYFETVVGSPAVTADGLQLASTAAAESVASGLLALQAAPQLPASVRRLKFRFDGSLPSVDVDLFSRAVSGTPDKVVLRYVAASQKLGLKLGTSAEQLSDATVAAGTWYVVDLRAWAPSTTSTAYACDWQVDYGAGPVAQPSVAFTGPGSMVSGVADTLGWAGAITVPGVTFAYHLCSNVAGHYPLGDFTMVLLKVDPAATPTISGTSTNFGVMTANGTIAAWNATGARDAVDDWPPVVGASADGAVCVTAHATDYMEFPLETYQAAPNGSIRAARVVIPVWAAAATVCTCRVIGWDGTTATTLFAEADPGTDNSATPAWICKMWRPTNGWTQAKLDAAAIRYGSNDATPDNGPHAIGMEVAVQLATAQPMFGTSGDVTVTAQYDPNSGGILGLATTTPAGLGATLHYEVNASPTDVTVPAASSDSRTLDAPDVVTVNRVELRPDPDPDQPG